MTRELQLKVSGMIFYIVWVAILVASRTGGTFVSNLLSQPGSIDAYQAVIAAIGAGAVVFTSDALGFIFATITFFCWNLGKRRLRGFATKSGYSLDWEKHLTYDWKGYIVRRYMKQASAGKEEARIDSSELDPDRFERQLKAYGTDVLLSYFWELAPARIGDWATRRYNAFHAHRSAIAAILLGLVAGLLSILHWRMGFTAAHWVVLILSGGLAVVLYYSAERSIAEAREIMNLWLARTVDPQFRKVFRELERETSVGPESRDDDTEK